MVTREQILSGIEKFVVNDVISKIQDRALCIVLDTALGFLKRRPELIGKWIDNPLFKTDGGYDVDTIAVDGFPKEALTDGYAYSTVQPRGTDVDLTGDVFSVAKQALVKDGKLNNLAASVNPCNVQLKFARATGIVTGTFALWSETGDGSAQKQITGIKHNGVLLLSRDAASPLPDDVLTAGFFTQPVKLPGRTWTFSAPFNILGAESE